MEPFTGFTQQTFAFFMEIAFNNTSQTMQKKRDVFLSQVLAPLRALSYACEKVLFEVDPKIDFRPVMGGTISRIRRDTPLLPQQTAVPGLHVGWTSAGKTRISILGSVFPFRRAGSSVLMGIARILNAGTQSIAPIRSASRPAVWGNCTNRCWLWDTRLKGTTIKKP